jgi:FtsH-binding integral membrane protein
MKDNYRSIISNSTKDLGINEQLRLYMLQVFTYMAMALSLSGVFAFGVMSSPTLMNQLIQSGLYWVVLLSPLAIAIYFSVRLNRLSYQTARILFLTYSALTGISLSFFLSMFTTISVAQTFFLTSGIFGAMALYGYTTKKDLTSLGSFLYMGLFGIIIAGLANMFFKNSAFQFLTSVLGVIIFTGLTAYDVQRIREMYFDGDSSYETVQKKALVGAFSLYMNFINLFIRLLSIFGDRRS